MADKHIMRIDWSDNGEGFWDHPEVAAILEDFPPHDEVYELSSSQADALKLAADRLAPGRDLFFLASREEAVENGWVEEE